MSVLPARAFKGLVEMVEYRIDELARAAGTTTRNVRAYVERGLLPPSTKKDGRALIYDDSHLERLKIIDALLQRGFTTAHIADFITSWETGKNLTEILGLQHAVTATWGNSEPTEPFEVPRELVENFLGSGDTELLQRLAEMGLVRLHGDNVVFTEPKLLDTFGDLHGYGFELRRIIDLFAGITEHVEDIAKMMITEAKTQITRQHGVGWLPETDDDIAALTAMLNDLRELGVASVQNRLAIALDKTLKDELGDYLAAAAAKHGVPTTPS
ncbi:MerR family transcriptional regulator [Antrihabitans stalactiti]|uniref:MerR family transcriptional regulator n=1 Tax=Antrihabitans stalactiti TaxID=2584121 RepID=UPI001F0E3553|nr:MerR family transcriptional regulator [Antrihabitans stalactiti]